MRVLCCLKRVVDPYVAVRLSADGGSVVTDNVKMSTNPFCENALEQALSWKDAGKASEVVALTVGPEAASQNLLAALALGADRAIRVDCGGPTGPLRTASVIAQVARREEADVVWLGKQSIDGDNNQTGQMAAALLGWPQALFLSKAEVNGNKVATESEVDDGIACHEVVLPCVLTADLRLNEPRYPALPAIIKAKSKPMETVALDSLDPLPDETCETVGLSLPPARSKGEIVGGAAALAEILRREVKALA